jgi:hypothetical protein
MNFTYQNHLKYHIDDRLYGYRQQGYETYQCSVGSVDPDRFNKSNFESELQRTAHLVANDYGRDFILLLSGGTDSEIVANNFVQIGHRPTCVTIRFKNNHNITDVEEAQRIATSLNLPLKVVDFDVKDFLFSGEAEEFGNSIQCTQITYLICYKIIHQLQTAAVMGGEALLSRHVNADPSYWYWTFRENEDASAIRFSLKYNLPLVNEWFSYTPELLLYYLTDTDIKNLVSEKYNYKLTSVSSKNRILKRLCPYVTPKKKTHGFEELLAFNFLSTKTIGRNQCRRLVHNIDGISYTQIIQQLSAPLWK